MKVKIFSSFKELFSFMMNYEGETTLRRPYEVFDKDNNLIGKLILNKKDK